MGTLIVHIGPPKTATTSLQYYWLNMENNDIKYLGVNQPRQGDCFSSKIYKYVVDKSSNANLKREIEEYLIHILKVYKYVIISEEMLSLESSNISYISKLKRLYDLIGVHQPIITYCYRNANDVYFSLYLEIFSSLPSKIQKSFKKFQLSSYSDCYKYRKIHNVLNQIGFVNINFFEFKSLVKGALMMNDILGTQDTNLSFYVVLEQKNSTEEKNKELEVIKRKYKFGFITSRLTKLIPKIIKKSNIYHLGKSLFVKQKRVKLMKQEILNFTKEEFEKDLIFIKHLKKE